MLDATQQHSRSLTEPRFLHWHRLLLPTSESLLAHGVLVGEWRGNEPMQVVSGRIDHPLVHFETPPAMGWRSTRYQINWKADQ